MKTTFQKLRDWWKQQEDPLPVYTPPTPVVKEDPKLTRILAMRATVAREAEELKARFAIENRRLDAFKVNDRFRWMGVDMHVASVEKGEVFDVIGEGDLRNVCEVMDRSEWAHYATVDKLRSLLLAGSAYGSICRSSPCVNLLYFAAGKGLCYHYVGAEHFDALLEARVKEVQS